MKEIILFKEDGTEVVLPTTFEVCPRCRGKGTHTNPAIDGNGLTQEDFDEDPDFRDNYFSGVYDVSCYKCDGLRVVPVVDKHACKSGDWEEYLL